MYFTSSRTRLREVALKLNWREFSCYDLMTWISLYSSEYLFPKFSIKNALSRCSTLMMHHKINFITSQRISFLTLRGEERYLGNRQFTQRWYDVLLVKLAGTCYQFLSGFDLWHYDGAYDILICWRHDIYNTKLFASRH